MMEFKIRKGRKVMIKFLLILLIASLVGIQMGMYTVFIKNEIPRTRALIHSFSIYLMPILLIMAHITLYSERHAALELRKKELTQEQYKNLKRIIDSKKFLVMSLLMALKDLFTPKDNFILLIRVTIIYDKHFTKRKRTKLIEREGIFGLIKKGASFIIRDLQNQASRQFILNKS